MTPLTRAEVLAWPAIGPMALKAERVLALLNRVAELEAEKKALHAAIVMAADRAMVGLKEFRTTMLENAP